MMLRSSVMPPAVMPAQAGISRGAAIALNHKTPAFAGVTMRGIVA